MVIPTLRKEVKSLLCLNHFVKKLLIAFSVHMIKNAK